MDRLSRFSVNTTNNSTLLIPTSAGVVGDNVYREFANECILVLDLPL